MDKNFRSTVLDYNAEWLHLHGTEAEKAEMLDALIFGTPTRTITISREGGSYKLYRVTVTDGIYHNEGFYASEDPKVRVLARTDNREDMARKAGKEFGRGLPAGWDVRIVNNIH